MGDIIPDHPHYDLVDTVEFYRKVLEMLDQEKSVGVLVVVAADGSTPQRVGAKALINGQGQLLAGTIGGGLMESEAVAHGAEVLRSGVARLFDFSMDEPYSRDAGPICGGTMRIFAAPCRFKDGQSYQHAWEATQMRQKGLLLTPLSGSEAGRTSWFSANELTNPDLAQKFGPFLANQKSGMFTDCQSQSQGQWFVEWVSPPPQMLIVGGGHVGQAVAQSATWLGFDVTVVDHRPQFVQKDRFPAGTNVICGQIRAEVERFAKDKDSFIILVSMGHKPDAEALEGCIHSKPAYIGMIGSRRKVALLRKHFVDSGLATGQEFERVFAPIGLDIGAITVEEIATSIMAQVVAIRRQ